MSMSKSKKRNGATRDETEVEEHIPPVKPPGQPMLRVEDMGVILNKYFNRPHFTWTSAEKDEIVLLMRNRSGLDNSNKQEIFKLGLTEKFEYFFRQYVECYEHDKVFEAAIDPWQVIVIRKPDNAARYVQTLNAANIHIGGNGIAGDADQPIQFQHGINWMLHIPSGHEDARRVVSYMAGDFVSHAIVFEAVVQDFRTSLKDA